MHKNYIIAFIGAFLINIHTNAQAIDTLENYIQLQIYNGDKDTIFINHARYHGLFVKDTCTTEDFGTKVITNLGCWKRVFNNFSPRFWAIGGQSPDNFIGTVVEEVDAINSAAIAAYWVGGDTIEIDSIYPIDRSVFLLSNNTYLGTSDSSGFVRMNPPTTILTDTAKFNDNKILVESNDGFRKFHKINIANASPFDSLAGHISYTASVSPFLGGGDTTIFLSGLKIQKQMLPGDSVSLFFPMMDSRFTELDSIYLENLVFDGNRDHYNLNYDWRTNSTIKIPSTNLSVIENCRFYNVPNENVFLCGAIFKDCSGINLNGSAVHFSCNDFDYTNEITYNNFTNMNEVGNEIMNHSEAGFTFSAKVQNFRMAYNNLQNIGEHGVGIFKNDDSSNEITDNLLDTNLEEVKFQAFYLYPESNTIYNNKNLNFTDEYSDSCWLGMPNLVDTFSCNGNSFLDAPLKIGDTITLTLDSFLVRNSNENFTKAILPIYNDEFFTLENIELNTPGISQYHQWNFEETPNFGKGLIFDNGHRNGIYGAGNWGYEPCGETGKCRELSFEFIVNNLPDSTSSVGCPLEGIEIKYDGDFETWNQPIFCQNEPHYFDSEILGMPFLEGKPTSTNILENDVAIEVFPNPSQDFIQIKTSIKGNLSYQILNSIGQITQKGNLENQPISIKNLPSGIYVVKIINNRKNYVQSFTKL